MKDHVTLPLLGRRTLLTGTSAAALCAGLSGLLAACTPEGGPPGKPGDAGTPSASSGELILPEDVRADPRSGTLSVAVMAAYRTYDLDGRTVRLRSYDGGPRPRTLRVAAGGTLNLALRNGFPTPPAGAQTPPNQGGHGEGGHGQGGHGQGHHAAPAMPGMSGPNVPHGFDMTNMHMHGLHVSPKSPADNVLLTVEPGQTENYSYRIPESHPCGLNFYHAHRHGSVALQVASGMAGALIVEGKVDRIGAIAKAKDVVMLLQSLPVDGKGTLEDYATLGNGTQVYINGQRRPSIPMKRGEVQRWRLVNATHDRFLTLTLEEHGFVALGFDGIPLETTETSPAIFLAPGNRAELLVKASNRPGRYTLDGGTNFGVSYGPLATVTIGREADDMTLYEGPLVDYGTDFAGHLRPVDDREILRGRHVGFGQIGTLPYWTWTIDGRPFSETETGFQAKLGTAEEWTLSNQTDDPHPFHIHINPFQVLEAKGLPVAVPPGRWMDTITIPPNGHIRFRTRYLDYDGIYVFHCHTLVHEDQGMMRKVTVER
ncbi:multicopper oxidase family protein [Azospirillum picis]|uniref:FtsP/CotA-like multicopper oxidase with cupredoxin domain n=1 Tax=Azospirillum picis TaxID=488438 RepID=A0ABU0MLQ2_9PROT|nr:multicopper oxidase family protein [Azospirillum picis]MBP2300982.1 FtsP/CotA-like multicopper oxidase with cupredoxin domain [Azospirillum picis]MDQ0534398.1 FtsP/CotA-like multicopper oxidase with cupredoxin domain [Azospirillum picis]